MEWNLGDQLRGYDNCPGQGLQGWTVGKKEKEKYCSDKKDKVQELSQCMGLVG